MATEAGKARTAKLAAKNAAAYGARQKAQRHTIAPKVPGAPENVPGALVDKLQEVKRPKAPVPNTGIQRLGSAPVGVGASGGPPTTLGTGPVGASGLGVSKSSPVTANGVTADGARAWNGPIPTLNELTSGGNYDTVMRSAVSRVKGAGLNLPKEYGAPAPTGPVGASGFEVSANAGAGGTMTRGGKQNFSGMVGSQPLGKTRGAFNMGMLGPGQAKLKMPPAFAAGKSFGVKAT